LNLHRHDSEVRARFTFRLRLHIYSTIVFIYGNTESSEQVQLNGTFWLLQRSFLVG